MPPAWSPQPGPQAEAIHTDWCPELLYGGARGGGKTDYLIGDWLQDVDVYGPLWQGIIFRRSFDPELIETMRRAAQIFPLTGGNYSSQHRQWEWPNGAILRLRYLDNDADAMRYQGHSYTWVAWDELTQWPSDDGYRFLFGSLRSPGGPVPTMRVRATANPGGPGHDWVKARFSIRDYPHGFEPVVDPDTGMRRMFIPSRVYDNKILLAHDPGYINRLRGVGTTARVQAWLEGDWSIIDGGQILRREWWRKWGVGKPPVPLTSDQHGRWRDGKPPECEHILMALDTAHEVKKINDPTGSQLWGTWKDATDTPHMMLLSAWARRMEFPELVRTVRDDVDTYQPDTLLVENKSSGIPLRQELRRQGIIVTAYEPGKRDKVARANAAAPTLEAGHLWYPDRRWAEDVIDECDAFPNGAHDEHVDCLTMAVERFRSARIVTVHESEIPDEKWLDHQKRERQERRLYG